MFTIGENEDALLVGLCFDLDVVFDQGRGVLPPHGDSVRFPGGERPGVRVSLDDQAREIWVYWIPRGPDRDSLDSLSSHVCTVLPIRGC